MGAEMDGGVVEFGSYGGGRRWEGMRGGKRFEHEKRDSLLEQIEKQTMSAAEMARTISGMKNIIFMLVGVYFLKEPVFRILRGVTPVHLELLQWSLAGFWKTMGLFGVASVGTFASYGLHCLCERRWISEPSREALHRVAMFVHILLSGKLLVHSDLSPVPSFALSCQAIAVFMKMHSYFVETRKYLASHVAEGKPTKECISLKSFLYFIVAPSLVYMPEGYPRIEKFRPRFFARKLFAAIGLTMTMYLITTESILPILRHVHSLRTYEFIWSLMLPCSAFFVSAFLLVFEAVLNIIAELTLFGDRLFYEDWWNCTTLDEFSRRWNRPVHQWLDRHVYRACVGKGIPKPVSMLMTFLFSAIFHEWVLALTFRRPRLYLFILMILQVPLIVLLRGRFRTAPSKRFANVFLWFGVFMGLGLLCSLYAREWYIDTTDVTEGSQLYIDTTDNAEASNFIPKFPL